MNCNQAKEHFFDAMEPNSAAAKHVSGCPECAAAMVQLKSTMTLLDEWKAPESSAYFNTRMQAKLAEARREESVPRSWASRLWTPAFLRPALVAAMGMAFVVGMNFYQPKVTKRNDVAMQQQKGTAVADLQALDSKEELYDEFDLLDDIGSNHAAQSQTTPQSTGSQL